MPDKWVAGIGREANAVRVMRRICPIGRVCFNRKFKPNSIIMTKTRSIDNWKNLPWHRWGGEIFRLQARIYQAAKLGNRRKVHDLQVLLLHSFAARCLAVRQVTQRNRGKQTPGVDGRIVVSDDERLSLARDLDLNPSGLPFRGVQIPKPGSTQTRCLSIPAIRDRCQQMLVKMAVEPEWEAVFEPNSYGFRHGRQPADAIDAVRNGIDKCEAGKFVLKADIRGCFDHIDHVALLHKLDAPAPITKLIRAWLKAGIVENGFYRRTRSGVAQGSIIGPLLANVALHGLETAVAGCLPKYQRIDGRRVSWKPILVRYADDFVVVHRDLDALLQCRKAAEEFLTRVGLELNPEKTVLAHTLDEDRGCQVGFDFLSFHIRSGRVGVNQKATDHRTIITLICPSKKAWMRHQQKLHKIIKRHANSSQSKLVTELNRVIRGWCHYHRTGNSAETFKEMDHLLWWKLARWVRRRHSSKTKGWVKARYWKGGQFTEGGGKPTLIWHREYRVTPHVKVRSDRSPYDRLDGYWQLCGERLKRRQAKHPHRREREEYLLDLHGDRPEDGSDFHCVVEDDETELPSLRA
jgi:RNA-directed DNA polymerase